MTDSIYMTYRLTMVNLRFIHILFGTLKFVLVQEPKEKNEVHYPLIVEFGKPVDQNINSCYYRFWPGDISRKEQETKMTFCSPE